MSALGNADAGAEAGLDLAHVDHPRHPHDLQHAVVVRRLRERVLPLGAPRVGARPPTVAQKIPDMTTPQNLFSEYQERKRGVLGLKEEF